MTELPRALEPGIDPPSDRYTLDGDDAVEARIAEDQRVIADAVTAILQPPAFRALVMMGGYGRGEGGFVNGPDGPGPYNDYDYFVVVRGMDRAARDALATKLAEAAQELEHKVGVEVDFALLQDEKLARAEYSLMNAEMLWGHMVTAGDPQVLAAMPTMPFATLPPGEFTRLMLNRGSLLLMNQQTLQTGKPLDAGQQEVLFKYLFKATLACGDTRLAGDGQYHPSYLVKKERLAAMDWPDKAAFDEVYALAYDNKFHPDYARFNDEPAADWQKKVVGIWLDTLAWFEGKRLGKPVGDWRAYCSPAVPKGQNNALGDVPRNAAITLRDFGPGELLRHPGWSRRYPRERLIAVLPLLLSEPGATDIGGPAAAALGIASGEDWGAIAEALLKLWSRFA